MSLTAATLFDYWCQHVRCSYGQWSDIWVGLLCLLWFRNT